LQTDLVAVTNKLSGGFLCLKILKQSNKYSLAHNYTVSGSATEKVNRFMSNWPILARVQARLSISRLEMFTP